MSQPCLHSYDATDKCKQALLESSAPRFDPWVLHVLPRWLSVGLTDSCSLVGREGGKRRRAAWQSSAENASIGFLEMIETVQSILHAVQVVGFLVILAGSGLYNEVIRLCLPENAVEDEASLQVSAMLSCRLTCSQLCNIWNVELHTPSGPTKRTLPHTISLSMPSPANPPVCPNLYVCLCTSQVYGTKIEHHVGHVELIQTPPRLIHICFTCTKTNGFPIAAPPPSPATPSSNCSRSMRRALSTVSKIMVPMQAPLLPNGQDVGGEQSGLPPLHPSGHTTPRPTHARTPKPSQYSLVRSLRAGPTILSPRSLTSPASLADSATSPPLLEGLAAGDPPETGGGMEDMR